MEAKHADELKRITKGGKHFRKHTINTHFRIHVWMQQISPLAKSFTVFTTFTKTKNTVQLFLNYSICRSKTALQEVFIQSIVIPLPIHYLANQQCVCLSLFILCHYWRWAACFNWNLFVCVHVCVSQCVCTSLHWHYCHSKNMATIQSTLATKQIDDSWSIEPNHETSTCI